MDWVFFLIILISALDPDDPLADLLEDLLPDEPKAPSKSVTQQPMPEKPSTLPAASLDVITKTSKACETLGCSENTAKLLSTPRMTVCPLAKAARSRADLMFEHNDKEDLMDTLGFDSDQNKPKKKETSLWPSKERLQLFVLLSLLIGQHIVNSYFFSEENKSQFYLLPVLFLSPQG